MSAQAARSRRYSNPSDATFDLPADDPADVMEAPLHPMHIELMDRVGHGRHAVIDDLPNPRRGAIAFYCGLATWAALFAAYRGISALF